MMEAEVDKRDVDYTNADSNFAVKVEDLCYSFGLIKKSPRILNDVSFQVEQGTVYGILGTNGCGKTTLLNCIVGILKPQSGKIEIFGQKPCSKNSVVPGGGLGLVPQEHVLYPELSVSETLLYFGRLHGLNLKTIEVSIKKLSTFLDVSSMDCRVGNLKPGEKRRVSIGIALIHQPPLLILDEPTLEMDSVVRKSIWNHLLQLVTSKHTSIIITTRNIEDAKQADTVGFMKDGKLLKEANKKQDALNGIDLEESFFGICKEDCSLKIASTNPLNGNDSILFINTRSDLQSRKDRVEMDEVTSLMKKNLIIKTKDWKSSQPSLPLYEDEYPKPSINRYIWTTVVILQAIFTRYCRSIPSLFLSVISPALVMLLLSISFGKKPTDIPMAIVNVEGPAGLSHVYVEHLIHQGIVEVKYKDYKRAVQSVHNGETWGVIQFPQNYSWHMIERLKDGIDADEATVNGSIVAIYLDNTLPTISQYIQMALFKAYQQFSVSSVKSLGLPHYVIKAGLEVIDPIYGRNEPNFFEFLAPPIILAAAYILATLATSMTLIEQLKGGLFERTWSCRLSSFQIMEPHLITEFILMAVRVIIMMLVANYASYSGFYGMGTWALLIMLLQIICGMTLGILLMAISKDYRFAAALAVGQFIPNMITSGIVWPVEGQPSWLRYISKCLPLTLPTSSIRSVMSRGWGIGHHDVYTGISIQLAWISVFTTATIIIFVFFHPKQ